MLCKKCGMQLSNGVLFCENCGEKVPEVNTSFETNKEFEIELPVEANNQKTKNHIIMKNKKMLILIGIFIIIILLIIFCCFILNKDKRTNVLADLDENDYLKFSIDGKDYYLGQKVSMLKEDGLFFMDGVVSEEDLILADNITVYPMYKDDSPVFLGALYCSLKTNCKYDDSILIKANFYDDVDVVIDDYIKIGMSYDDIVDEYGEEDGKFYQDNSMKVWVIGDKGKIGEPYYIIKFNSSKKVTEIRIGLWWYLEEFEYMIK